MQHARLLVMEHASGRMVLFSVKKLQIFVAVKFWLLAWLLSLWLWTLHWCGNLNILHNFLICLYHLFSYVYQAIEW